MFCPIGSRGMAENNKLKCMGEECAFWLKEGEKQGCTLVAIARSMAKTLLVENRNTYDFKDVLPPIIKRSEIEKHLNGIFSRGYMQNLDSIGKGPRRIKIGQAVYYLREDLLEWIESKTDVPDKLENLTSPPSTSPAPSQV